MHSYHFRMASQWNSHKLAKLTDELNQMSSQVPLTVESMEDLGKGLRAISAELDRLERLREPFVIQEEPF
jgi:hypothetical protein